MQAINQATAVVGTDGLMLMPAALVVSVGVRISSRIRAAEACSSKAPKNRERFESVIKRHMYTELRNGYSCVVVAAVLLAAIRRIFGERDFRERLVLASVLTAGVCTGVQLIPNDDEHLFDQIRSHSVATELRLARRDFYHALNVTTLSALFILSFAIYSNLIF